MSYLQCCELRSLLEHHQCMGIYLMRLPQIRQLEGTCQWYDWYHSMCMRGIIILFNSDIYWCCVIDIVSLSVPKLYMMACMDYFLTDLFYPLHWKKLWYYNAAGSSIPVRDLLRKIPDIQLISALKAVGKEMYKREIPLCGSKLKICNQPMYYTSEFEYQFSFLYFFTLQLFQVHQCTLIPDILENLLYVLKNLFLTVEIMYI